MIIRCTFLVTLGIFFLFVSSPVVGAFIPADKDVTEKTGFVILVQESGQWVKHGFLSFNDVFSEKSFSLETSSSPVVIRLVKKGKGAAHIDRALMNFHPPLAVKGAADQIPLSKLSNKDFDVLHYNQSGNGIELVFPEAGALLLAARVESEHISTVPFRFPASNNYRDLADLTEFYTVELSDQPSVIFDERTVPGSGHPVGRARGSAVVKESSLHIRFDFESDNTLDDDEDYAAVHVRTEKGVKTYHISQEDQQWGKVRFCYTPGLPWQHKVYDFSLPLEDLEEDEKVEIAMSGYGTAANGGNFGAAAAYGKNNEQYLAAYYYSNGATFQVRTQLLDSMGVPIGSELNLTTADSEGKSEEAVAYNPITDQFLITWVQPRGGIYAVHTQRVSSANKHIDGDPQVAVAIEGQHSPAVSFSPKNNSYFLVWEEKKSSGTYDDIYGNVTTHDNQMGSSFVITNAAGFQSYPHLDYHSIADTFYIVWDSFNESTTRLQGRIVSADGTMHGIPTSLHVGPASQFNPDIAVDAKSNRSLLVWEDRRNLSTSDVDIYAGILGDGLLEIGEAFSLTTASGDQLYPHVTFVGEGVFLVTWEDRGQNITALHGQFVHSSGRLLGGEKVITRLDVDISESSLITAENNAVLALYQFIDIEAVTNEFDGEIVRYSNPWKLFLHLPPIINGKSDP